MGNVQTAASAYEAQGRQAPVGELVDLGRPHRLEEISLGCRRAFKFDHLCALNFDQG